MKRWLFAPVNSVPFGQDAEEATEIIDDLPGIFPGQGSHHASLELSGRIPEERVVNGAPS